MGSFVFQLPMSNYKGIWMAIFADVYVPLSSTLRWYSEFSGFLDWL